MRESNTDLTEALCVAQYTVDPASNRRQFALDVPEAQFEVYTSTKRPPGLKASSSPRRAPPHFPVLFPRSNTSFGTETFTQVDEAEGVPLATTSTFSTAIHLHPRSYTSLGKEVSRRLWLAPYRKDTMILTQVSPGSSLNVTKVGLYYGSGLRLVRLAYISRNAAPGIQA